MADKNIQITARNAANTGWDNLFPLTTKTNAGLGNVENYAIATQLEAQQGTVTNKYMNPLRTKEAILALAPAPVIASTAEAQAGTENTKMMTPLRVKEATTAQSAPLAHVGATGVAHGAATTSVDGFMASGDKTKLDGIAVGAQVNQTITAGNGMNFTTTSGNVTIAMGTPTGLTAATTNATTATSHTHAVTGFLPMTGGTLTGVLYPQNNTLYTTGQARRIILSTGNATGGGNGDVWLKYV